MTAAPRTERLMFAIGAHRIAVTLDPTSVLQTGGAWWFLMKLALDPEIPLSVEHVRRMMQDIQRLA